MRDSHELAGKTVVLQCNTDSHGFSGLHFTIEDWWENVSGRSWMVSNGNPAALEYAIRSGMSHLPIDNEVVYGKIGAFGHLIHISELGPVVEK